jgi:hypothetical protein
MTVMRWTGHVVAWGRRGVHIGYWWGKKRQLGRPSNRLKDNVKMDLR